MKKLKQKLYTIKFARYLGIGWYAVFHKAEAAKATQARMDPKQFKLWIANYLAIAKSTTGYSGGKLFRAAYDLLYGSNYYVLVNEYDFTAARMIFKELKEINTSKDKAAKEFLSPMYFDTVNELVNEGHKDFRIVIN